jgi:sodium-independent sulfate anion transporter 11
MPYEKHGLKAKTVKLAKKVVGAPEDAPETVHSIDYLRGKTGNVKSTTLGYVKSLFPFIQWLPNYNLTWLVGDLIA